MKRLHHKDHPAFLIPRLVGKAPVRRERASQPENTTLAEACAWLDSIGIVWFHLPHWLMELAFGQQQANPDPEVRESAAEVSGYPDLTLFYRGRYLAVEMKTEIGTMRKSQRDWMARIGTQVPRTLPAFQAAVLEWKRNCET